MAADIKNRAVVKEQMFIEQGGLCYLCGGRMGRTVVERAGSRHLWATIDHILPKVRGGTSRRDNLKLCHRICNTWKGDSLVEELPALGLTVETEVKS